MIDEKKIEEAAEKYAADTYAFNEPVPTEYKEGIQEVFQTSINWFKENLWHDASEEPEKNKHILLVYDNQNPPEKNIFPYGYECLDGNLAKDYWKYIVKIGHITRWLYIEDLMKGGK